jgi:uncharacterized protein (DUF2252 family)
MSAPTEPSYAFGRPAISPSEAVARGSELRKQIPRRTLAKFIGAEDRDPVAILEHQNLDRLPELVPIRIGRMLQSPFAYYRGTAAVMANDLVADARTGVDLVVCGDAHLSNFGLFASPERRVVFDLNDFDEAAFGPWEWDVKRLVTSVVVAGRVIGLSRAECTSAAAATAESYRLALASLFRMTALQRFYFRVETDWLEARVDAQAQKLLRKTVAHARRRTSDRVLSSITTTDATGQPRIVDQDPIIRHDDSVDVSQARKTYDEYRRTVRTDVALLLEQFRLVDVARRVVGVGSVGTRGVIALLLGPADEPLFLQMKEASTSVLESYGRLGDRVARATSDKSSGREGWRVVAGQQVLQAVSDPFLGWVTVDGRDFYCRQFRDMKGSVDLQDLTPAQFISYSELCGAVLARGHAQSRDAIVVSAYLGRSGRFDEALATWAQSYADQVERDYAELRGAVKRGRLPAEEGV